MNLHVHDRTRVLEPLPVAESSALLACFGAIAESTEELEHLAARTLARLRDHRHWIACSCMPSEGEGPPLMAPRQREGILHIVRLAGAPHARECPFYRDPAQSSTETDAVPMGQGRLQAAGASWLALDSLKGESKSSLAAILFTALESVGLSIIHPGEIRSVRGQVPCASLKAQHYQRLARLSEREIAPGISWGVAGCTFLPRLQRFMSIDLPAHIDAFKEHRPQGLFIGLIQGIERDGSRALLHWSGSIRGEHVEARVIVDGTIKRFGSVRDTSGPFWCAAAVGRRLGEDVFRVLHAYVHPVYSKSLLFPVDSDAERLTAQVLLDQIAYWAKPAALGVEVVLEKPLFDLRSASDDMWCRPDFMLRLPNGALIVIEAMGRDDAQYLTYKERLHNGMRSIADVVALIAFRPGQDDESEFRRSLTRLVRQHTGPTSKRSND